MWLPGRGRSGHGSSGTRTSGRRSDDGRPPEVGRTSPLGRESMLPDARRRDQQPLGHMLAKVRSLLGPPICGALDGVLYLALPQLFLTQRAAGPCRRARGGAELLFQVLTEREEKTAVAIASNDSFSGWTKTFTDPRLCAAIVDRLTFGGNIIETGTHSYRLAHARSRRGRNA